MHPLLEQANTRGTPLVFDDEVVFIWEGNHAPYLISDLTNWESDPIQLVQIEENLWFHSCQILSNAYIEYAFIDLESGERLPDPYNSHLVQNGLGKSNHFFYMPSTSPDSNTNRDPTIQLGKLTHHKVATYPFAAGEDRKIFLYQPPVYYPVPLIVIYDGNEFLKYGHLSTIINNMTAKKLINPVALALISNHPQARMLEYACNDVTIEFIIERILPLAFDQLNLLNPSEHPGSFGVMGASMGGLMALYTALRIPDLFGCVLALSGAYSIPGHEFIVYDMVRHFNLPAIKLWMGVGIYETLLETNREIHNLLIQQGLMHGYCEYAGGHNYTSWRNHSPIGFEYLFPHQV